MCPFDNDIVVVEFSSYFLTAFRCSSLFSNTLRQRDRRDKVPSPSCASKVLPSLFYYYTVCGTQTAAVHFDSPFEARHRVRQGLCFSVGCPLACTPSARGGTAPRKVAPDEGKTSADIGFRGVTRPFFEVYAVFVTREQCFLLFVKNYGL